MEKKKEGRIYGCCRGVNSFSRKYLPSPLPSLSLSLFVSGVIPPNEEEYNREIVRSLGALRCGEPRLFRNRDLEFPRWDRLGPIVDLDHGLTRFGENLRPNLFFFSFFFSKQLIAAEKLGQICVTLVNSPKFGRECVIDREDS